MLPFDAPEPDSDPGVAVPDTLSNWLREHDVAELAGFARAARRADGSFARHLREHG
ncbi:hypothetical protein LQ327_21140 [Actinomycetospora endophytica]|uniref:Uncharacterized protein n=1 Tax=Actinomycetospora endophytica TaxID=2291215 RepID=A0ABS8PC74_9PSEU|nr:hypothetical protein [Actinomycetospora endophytica]MCD2195880.1 hypothetical protein [Actinomycetospora endophytica]